MVEIFSYYAADEAKDGKKITLTTGNQKSDWNRNGLL